MLLSIRTTLKPDLGASPADLVFGEQLAVPGEALPVNPADGKQLSRQRAAALAASELRSLDFNLCRRQPIVNR